LKEFKAVIFDLDGTLVDSMWIWDDIDIQYLKKHGFTLPDDLQKAIEGMSFSETAAYFKERFKIADDVETIKSEWVQMAAEYYASRIPLKKGVRKFIEKLVKRGIPLGIGTSNSRELATMALQNHRIEACFSVMVTSCEVSKGKPAPDVFLKAAELLGVLPEDCLVFEDTCAGIQAALNAGMQVVGIRDASSQNYVTEIERLVSIYADDFESLLDLVC